LSEVPRGTSVTAPDFSQKGAIARRVKRVCGGLALGSFLQERWKGFKRNGRKAERLGIGK